MKSKELKELKEKIIEFLSKENIEIEFADITYDSVKERNGVNFNNVIDTGTRTMKIYIIDRDVKYKT